MNKQTFKRSLAKLSVGKYRQGLIILNYHSVCPGHNFSLPPEEFAKQMEYLRDNFSVIPLKGLDDLATTDLSVAITFDDGYEDNYLYAYPVLKHLNLPATIFVTTGFVLHGLNIARDWPEYRGLAPLKPEQLKEMAGNNISFGSHGRTHARASDLNQESFSAELASSRHDLESLGISPIGYAFPFGQAKDRPNWAPGLIKESGYNLACGTDWGLNQQPFNRFNLKRIRIDHFDTLNDFQSKLSGRWDFIRHFQAFRKLWPRKS